MKMYKTSVYNIKLYNIIQFLNLSISYFLAVDLWTFHVHNFNKTVITLLTPI